MNKQILERFMSKYSLSGAAESVLWTTADDKLQTKFITDDKSVLGVIVAKADGNKDFFKGFDVMGGEDIAINATSQLRSLLGVVGEDVKIAFEKASGKLVALRISDKGTKVAYVLADASVVPTVPALKSLPEFEIELKLDDEFMATFIKAKSALPEVETFTVISDGKKVSLVIGYSKINTNRVTIDVDATKSEKIDAISFSARYFGHILSANKECKDAVLRVSSQGLAHAVFKTDNFESEYYLVQITTTT